MDEIESKMMRAYLTAMKLERETREPSSLVTIHVGQQGWDWLNSHAVHDGDDVRARPWLSRAWGYPVVLDLPDDQVRVRLEVPIP